MPHSTLTPAWLTPDEVAAFRREGYLIVRNMVADSLRNMMLQSTLYDLEQEVPPLEFEAEVRYPGAPAGLDAEGGRTVRRLKQALTRHPAFLQWVSSPELVGRLQQLLGARIVMPLGHHNCVMTKQPRYSSDTLWHQDIRYWSFERPELVSAWLALGSERTENGCLYVIPGTHTLPIARERLDAELFLRPELPENQELIARKAPAELAPGDVLLFHGRTFHAAGRNRTAEPKFSVVFTFRPEDNRPIPESRSAAFPELILPYFPQSEKA